MRIDRRLFRSKLAHRVFLAFVLCALVPIGIVALLSYRSVTDQLLAQASLRLHQASKALGLSMYERLLFAESELVTVSTDEAQLAKMETGPIDGERMRGIMVADIGSLDVGDQTDDSAGSFQLRQREAHLAQGMSVLLSFPGHGGSNPVRLARRLDPGDPRSKMVVGELDPNYLWGLDAGNLVPAGAEFCVFGAPGRLIYGSFEGCDEVSEAVRDRPPVARREASEVVFSVDSMSGENYVVGNRELFLDARFDARDWMIVVCEPRSAVVQPIHRWRLLFPAVMLLALWLVLLMIIAAIRKNLDPIDRLREAASHLGGRDFDHEVVIRTGDEFEELAGAFNRMSRRLRRQFGSLATTGEIHRAILSSVDTRRIVEATIRGVLIYFECDRAAVVVLRDDGDSVDRSAAAKDDDETLGNDEVAVSPDLRAELGRVSPNALIGHELPAPPEIAEVLDLGGMGSVVVVPIFNRGSIAALVGLGYRASRSIPDEDLEHLSEIADQFAVALANARMLEEVNGFSLGTLDALARAVDAKSPWTAGHSERVTRLALTIGAEMDLDSSELSRLHRGALLHDIGKIGISPSILDKRGRLDQDEFDIVRSHTTIGERILEPINAFADIMPVVTQHHERFDGSGYPLGLAGVEIDVKARVLAVADVYDAMTNHRPYRKRVEPLEVVKMIQSEAGSQFDPDVVGAFMRLIDARGGLDQLVALNQDFSFFPGQGSEEEWESGVWRTGELS